MAHTVEPLMWRKGFAPKQIPPSEALQRQMRLAAQFARFAADHDDLQMLQHEVCRVAAEGSKGAFAKLLVYQSNEQMFVLEAGLGWKAGTVGIARISADCDTTAGYAWYSGHSVIASDIACDGRFRVPALDADHEVTSCINVVIPGPSKAAYGVLEVGSCDPGRFALQDVSFLQLLAHSLASALGQSVLRKMYETQAARSMLTHNVSLHELQHRMRNDLQVIYAITATEERRTVDPAVKTSLARVGGRIMALAELYNHLLGQWEIDEVDMGAYLGSLCNKIASATDLSARGITLNAETERLMMPLDRAVKLAVAVNELVANAVKHAFSDKASGRITVGLIAKDADGDCPVVSIADNGCGFNGPRPGGDGLTFVKQLTHQVGGVLGREDIGGTKWRIRLIS